MVLRSDEASDSGPVLRVLMTMLLVFVMPWADWVAAIACPDPARMREKANGCRLNDASDRLTIADRGRAPGADAHRPRAKLDEIAPPRQDEARLATFKAASKRGNKS